MSKNIGTILYLFAVVVVLSSVAVKRICPLSKRSLLTLLVYNITHIIVKRKRGAMFLSCLLRFVKV